MFPQSSACNSKTGCGRKARACASASSRCFIRVAKTVCLHEARRLGLCQQALQGKDALLGTGDLAQACSTGCAASWYPEMQRMAHVSPYVFDSAEKRGYGIQGDTRAVAAFISAIHIGYLHPS